MAPDCLEKLAAALNRHPECQLAHCSLRIVDQSGNESHDWWPSGSLFARSSDGLLYRPHVRLAPFDGLLHLTGESVYVSITQLLIRRSLFDQIGFLTSRWGSVGDFNWCMRASLVANTVHVPETWGGWRVYEGQATAAAGLGSPEHDRKIDAMIADALEFWLQTDSDGVLPDQKRAWAARGNALRQLHRELEQRPRCSRRWPFLLKELVSGSWAARQHIRSRVGHRDVWPGAAGKIIRRWLLEAGPGPALVPVSGSAGDQSRRELAAA